MQACHYCTYNISFYCNRLYCTLSDPHKHVSAYMHDVKLRTSGQQLNSSGKMSHLLQILDTHLGQLTSCCLIIHIAQYVFFFHVRQGWLNQLTSCTWPFACPSVVCDSLISVPPSRWNSESFYGWYIEWWLSSHGNFCAILGSNRSGALWTRRRHRAETVLWYEGHWRQVSEGKYAQVRLARQKPPLIFKWTYYCVAPISTMRELKWKQCVTLTDRRLTEPCTTAHNSSQILRYLFNEKRQ